MNREHVRGLVRGVYDIQKLRIQAGNRIVANAKVKLGQKPGKREDTMNAEALEILKLVREHYDRLADGLVHMRDLVIEGEGPISNVAEFALVRQYVELLGTEQDQFKLLDETLKYFPIWTEWLQNVVGIGPAMAGVIISEFDIHRARYPSSMWKYAGLDVGSNWVLQGTTIRRTNLAKPDPTLSVDVELRAIEDDGECVVEGGTVVDRGWAEDEPTRRPQAHAEVSAAGRDVCVVRVERDGYEIDATYRVFHTGGRSKRKEHLVRVEYKDKKGKMQERDSITFNPWLKTKLIGVLAPIFVKQVKFVVTTKDVYDATAESQRRLVEDAETGEPIYKVVDWRGVYREIYDDYKHRLECHPVHQEKTKGHRHAMAMRYIIKRFVADLYRAWREIEGLPVAPEYAEAKLGIVHGAA